MGQSLCQGDHGDHYKGEPRQKGSYQGDVDELGRPDGQGVMFYKDGSKFVGTLEKGRPSLGKFSYPNGDTYEGHLTKCKPHGKGVWKQKNGTFDGQFEDGEFTNGTITYSDGSKYIGSMRHNQKDGDNCEFIYADGEKFQGRFKDNTLNNGTLEKRDGTSYVGQFKDGKKTGHGVYRLKGQLQYEGQFEEDEFHGKGKLRNLAKGTQYVGDFMMGKKHGRGVLRESNGAVYDGQFRNNEKHGEGVFTHNSKTYRGQFREGHFWGEGSLNYGNGDQYEGSFVKDKKEGHGKLKITRLNEEYVGDFVNDKMEGHGRLMFSNGDVYDGEWKQGKKHGRGKIELKQKGQTQEGSWANDLKEGQFTETRTKENDKLIGNYTKGNRDGKFRFYDLSSGEQNREQQWKEGVFLYK